MEAESIPLLDSQVPFYPRKLQGSKYISSGTRYLLIPLQPGKDREDIPFTHPAIGEVIYMAFFDPKPSAQEINAMIPIAPAMIILACSAVSDLYTLLITNCFDSFLLHCESMNPG
jgi:hypothetical protein